MSPRSSLLLLAAGCGVAAPPAAPTPAQAARLRGGEHTILSRIEVAPTTESDGVAVYTYEVAPDAPALRVDLGFGEAEINDRGEGADRKARDGVYTGKVPFVRAEHDAAAAAYLASIAKEEGARVMGFDGLQVIDAAPFDPSLLSAAGSVVVQGSREPLPTIVLFPSVNEDAVAGLAGLPASSSAARMLTVTDPGVVRDPSRTGVWVRNGNSCEQVGDPTGPWGIVGLMEGIGGGYATSHDMVMDWLKLYGVNRSINGQPLLFAPMGLNMLIEGDHGNLGIPAVPWPRFVDDGNPWTYNDVMDMSQMPVQLTAIVNRPDLALTSYDGGERGPELRFVFTFISEETCEPAPGGFILEYDVPTGGCSGIESYFQAWSDLGALIPGDPDYNDALQQITEPVTMAGAAPGRPNESNLKVLRTNEQNIRWDDYLNDFPVLNTSSWVIQQFSVDPGSHRFVDNPLPQTPGWEYEMIDWNDPAPRGQAIDAFITDNAADIIAGTYEVALTHPTSGDPFRGGFAMYGEFEMNTITPPYVWGMGDPNNNGKMTRMLSWGSGLIETGNIEARKRFSLNTCNGCHYGETFEDGDGAAVFERRHEGASTPGGVLEHPFRHVEPDVNLALPAHLSRFLTGTNATCGAAEFVAPLGPLPSCPSASCCPIGDPVFGYDRGQAHFNDHARRGQILQDVVTNGCAVLDGHAAADVIVSAAH